MELLRSYQTREFAAAALIVLNLPNDLSPQELEKRLGEKMELVFVLLVTFESLGILVFRGEVTLDLVEDYFSGLIRITWLKLAPFIEYVRARDQRETLAEWLQWLNDRIAERESKTPPIPAHVQFRSWRPADSN